MGLLKTRNNQQGNRGIFEMSLKYPRLTFDQKRSTKLCWAEVEQIRELYKIGKTYLELSLLFKVSYSTIQYWIDEKYRKKQNSRKKAPLTNKQKNQQSESFTLRLKTISKPYFLIL